MVDRIQVRDARRAPDGAASDQVLVALLRNDYRLERLSGWDALGMRYYYDAAYSNGGDAMFRKAGEAYAKAVALDPNFIAAAAKLVRNNVESGDLATGYREATDLLRRRPDGAQAHFTLSYVLRYAGLLDRAQKECDVALGLDPGNYGFRSCAFPFFEAGKAERAMDYLRLDATSEWSRNVLPAVRPDTAFRT